MGVDDPVGASAVHGLGGIWGVVSVGLFADDPKPLETTSGRTGLFKGGGWYLLGVQCLTAFCLLCWGILSTGLLLWIINRIIPIRMDPNEELVGADLCEHKIKHDGVCQRVTSQNEFLMKLMEKTYSPYTCLRRLACQGHCQL